MNNIYGGYNCPNCNRNYKYKSNLRRHIKFDCRKSEQLFECNVCSQKLTMKNILQHSLEHKQDGFL